ncbi:MAG: hypothetical protein QM526_00520 [Alphaproteobacteria bacterium]|nr:hypothetical protein [Alphaproteobacteria bacterium]
MIIIKYLKSFFKGKNETKIIEVGSVEQTVRLIIKYGENFIDFGKNRKKWIDKNKTYNEQLPIMFVGRCIKSINGKSWHLYISFQQNEPLLKTIELIFPEVKKEGQIFLYTGSFKKVYIKKIENSFYIYMNDYLIAELTT